MKKIFYVLFAVILTVACTPENPEYQPDTTLYRTGTVNLCASIEEIQTRMVMDLLYAAAPVLLEEEKNFSLLCQEYTLGGKKEEGGRGAIHFASIDIAGRIDRIELSKDKKVLRVLDFKTSNTGEDPQDAHCKGKGENMEFISLQLPLYAILLRKDPFFAEKYPFLDLENIKIECGYFNLPN